MVTTAEESLRTRSRTGPIICSRCLTLAETLLLGNPFRNAWRFPSQLPRAALAKHHHPQTHPGSLPLNKSRLSDFRFCYPPIPALANQSGQRSPRVLSGPRPVPRGSLGWGRLWLWLQQQASKRVSQTWSNSSSLQAHPPAQPCLSLPVSSNSTRSLPPACFPPHV